MYQFTVLDEWYPILPIYQYTIITPLIQSILKMQNLYRLSNYSSLVSVSCHKMAKNSFFQVCGVLLLNSCRVQISKLMWVVSVVFNLDLLQQLAKKEQFYLQGPVGKRRIQKCQTADFSLIIGLIYHPVKKYKNT